MKNTILAAAALLLLASCKKDVDTLPEATQTGAEIFGAKVNGENWIPRRGLVGGAQILEARFTGTGGLFINARDLSSSPTETEFELYIQNISSTGVFPLEGATDRYPNQSASYGFYTRRRFNPLNDWITGPQYPGSITITRFDTAARIVSGTFSFRAGSTDNTADPIEVAEGRFDVKVN